MKTRVSGHIGFQVPGTASLQLAAHGKCKEKPCGRTVLDTCACEFQTRASRAQPLLDRRNIDGHHCAEGRKFGNAVSLELGTPEDFVFEGEVNGVAMIDVEDNSDSEGIVGIQHHGEKIQTYKFRKLRIKELK